jgi:hypothetical protein
VGLSESNILNNKKIVFGHQSVGGNIVDGIRLIQSEQTDLNMNILETKSLPSSTAGYFAHHPVGQNRHPQSKSKEFTAIIESNQDRLPDIALHKYCYIDIDTTSDINSIFDEYSNYMNDLSERYPQVTFAHCTVPLTTIQKGPKALVKRLLNKRPYGIDDNIARNTYNELLRDAYGDTGLVFDLAEFEARQLSGGHEVFFQKNTQYMCLSEAYTDDGGHLNMTGQRHIANQFLSFLRTIAEKN